MTGPETIWESVKVEGGQLLTVLRGLIREGNVRHVIIRQQERILMEFPLSVGLIGVALAPIFAVLGTAAVMFTECTIDVERQVRPAGPAERRSDQ
ncbi:MAG TPA: DUF4342 domain-containing protein [Vicinamibacterales bacterium]|nr:DUF4342 domain-containing protein [Vicinamibacterales bacterium]